MKHFINFSLLICTAILLGACQTSELSSDLSSVATSEQTVKAPIRAIPVDVSSTYINPQAIMPQAISVDSGNLFGNGGFESGLEGWTGCESSAIEVSTDSYEDKQALKVNKGNCFYRSVEVSPGQELILSCYAKLLSGRAWTGMGLGFADSNWNTVGEGPSTVITGNSYQRYDVKATVPDKASYVSMWLYSDNDAVVDAISAAPSQPLSWAIGCGGNHSYDILAGLVVLEGGACMDQSLSAEDIAALKGRDYTYSCSVKNTGGYASMSIFLDGQPTSVVIPSSSSFQTVEVKGTAGINIGSGFVSLYGEGKSLTVDSCSLRTGLVEPPGNPRVEVRNFGADTLDVTSFEEFEVYIRNSGDVAFASVTASSDTLSCGTSAKDVDVNELISFVCAVPDLASGEELYSTVTVIATTADGVTVTAEDTVRLANSNYLQNGRFEELSNGFSSDWVAGCGGKADVVDGFYANEIRLTGGSCVDQQIENEIRNKTISLSCRTKNTGGYAAMSILDGDSGRVVATRVIPVADIYGLTSIVNLGVGTLNNPIVSLYSEGELFVDNCEFRIRG